MLEEYASWKQNEAAQIAPGVRDAIRSRATSERSRAIMPRRLSEKSCATQAPLLQLSEEIVARLDEIGGE